MPTRKQATPPKGRRKPAPVVVVKPAPEVWARAMLLAGGDPNRLTVGRDGTVTVHNQPIR